MAKRNTNKKLVDDVKVVLSDLDDVLDDIKGKTAKEFAQMQDSLSEKLMSAKEKLLASEQDLLGKEKVAAEMTDNYARSNAWKLIVIAAVLGFLIGYTL
jgi:ElaB/YqjD/DUF883 family membrane-anchored ribosome-binding protein